MSVALPAQLAGITEREAIADALYRAVLAFDLVDETLLLSAITDDVSISIGHISTKGIPEFIAQVFGRVSKLDTTHFLSNVRVTTENATAAKVSCSALAQHVTPGKGFEPGPYRYTSGGLYLCDVVKVGDLWKIKDWKANIVWVDGNRDVMTGR